MIAGPDANIVEFGGVALASDGTGGAIWRTKSDAGTHVYVARYISGRWLPAQRIDTSLPYDSFEPRLAAAPNGQLMAVWAQAFAQAGAIGSSHLLYQLQYSQIRPGASRFETPLSIQRRIGSDTGVADDLDPVLRMNDSGVAYLAYRVVKIANATSADAQPRRPGDSLSEFRVARFNGGSWSVLGAVNRNLGYTVPKAAAGNGPQVTVDRLGNGVVAFLEPDAAGVERVWARRLFAGRMGLVLKVSPTTYNGQPLGGNATAFSLSGNGLGAATAVTRQDPGRPSPLPGTRMFLTRLVNGEQDSAQLFNTPELVDDGADDYSSPSTSMDADEASSFAYSSGGHVRFSGVPRGTLPTPTELGPIADDSAPQVTNGPSGASVVAWPSIADSGVPGVTVRQALPGGNIDRAVLAGQTIGPVSDASLAGSGLGDALVGFRQGEGAETQIVVSAAQVAPQPFGIAPPADWVQPSQAVILWDRAVSGTGGVGYDLYLDGDRIARGLTGVSFGIPAALLDDGTHKVQVRATDLAGSTATSRLASFDVDGTPPIARATTRSGKRVSIRVVDRLDGTSAGGSGVDPDSVRIRFGDGTTANGYRAAGHQYRRAGKFVVRVSARDKAGNQAYLRLRVTVR